MGFSYSTVYLGAYFENTLVGVMTFRNGSINTDGWELTRFAVDNDYICCGLGGKLFSYFVKNYNPSKITSFADKRYTSSKNNLYLKIGFVSEKTTSLSYNYFKANEEGVPQLVHKLTYKNNCHDSQKTESEAAKELGFDRIWNCGLIKYIWRKDDEEK